MESLKRGMGLVSVKDSVDATLRNLEGKAQVVVGDLTGNPTDKAEGKAKQAEAKIMQAQENIKEKLDKALD